MHSWRVLILPIIGEQALYDRYDFTKPWDSPENRLLLSQRPGLFALHDRNNDGGSTTNYLAVVGAETAWSVESPFSLDRITDGPPNTILVVENVGSGIHWTEPADLNFDSMSFELASSPPNGISSSYLPSAALTADGFVRVLPADEFPPERLRAMLTAAAGDEPSPYPAATIEDGRNRPLRSVSDSP